MKAFYTALLEKLQSNSFKQELANTGISPLKLIDLYRQQEHFDENFDLFANAVLVEWEIAYDENPAIATITLHCCFEQLRDTSNLSSHPEHALKFFDFYELIDQAVRTIETEETGKLSLTHEGQDKMDSIVDVYLLMYQCTYNGRKRKRDYQDGEFEAVELTGKLKEHLSTTNKIVDNLYSV